MAPKNKQQPPNKEGLYFVVRDKSSRHHICNRHNLQYDKKDNLKVGSNATFPSSDDPSGRSQCTIVMSGTKQQCDNTLSLLDKAMDTNHNQNLNNENTKDSSAKQSDNAKVKKKNLSKSKTDNSNNINTIDNSKKRKNNIDVQKPSNKKQRVIRKTTSDKENLADGIDIANTSKRTQRDVTYTNAPIINPDEEAQDDPESEPSSRLFIDDKVENSDDDDDHSSDEELDNGSSAFTEPKESQQFINRNILTSQHDTVSKDTDDNYIISIEDELLANLNPDVNSKTSTKISNRDYEKLKQENIKLKKAIDVLKSSWMPRPTGTTANYFISIGKILSGSSDDPSGEEEKGDVLEKIKDTLCMTELELKACEHESDITKTCRKIAKHLYPDLQVRSKMLISTMDPEQLRAIQMYAKLVHPVNANISNSILNNAIGNVFATEKIKSDNNENSNTI